ncbi:MAG TPA: sigma-70 family RNA polymerase sigma factor [Caulobacteraceae bacterium]|nr:sigma-70 family RNA polymerase sigma factor [Caulobacteraceae bacterium]
MTGLEQDRQWALWMAAAQDGDNAAYARLLRNILPFLRVLARRRCRDPDRCEDIVQDVLLTLHRVRHTYEPARPFSPWLAAICDRRAIDSLRRHGRLRARETSDEHAYETFADPAANKDVQAQDAAQALAALVAALPQAQREALELVKVKEMSLLEASAVSGQSVGALKVSVHRAIKALRLKARAPE